MQLLLARLQLLSLGLRLLEQLLGDRCRLHGVEHEADALRELIEQRLMRRAEGGERGQLDDRAHGALEQDRQDDDVQRWRLAQARVDPDVIRRHIGQQDALLFQRTLPDEALAEAEMVGQVLALLVAVAGLELQDGLAAVAEIGQGVEHSVLRRDERCEL